MLAPSITSFALLALSASSAFAKQFNQANLKEVLADKARVPGRFIVELSDASALGRRDGLSPHDRFDQHVKRASLDVSTSLRYDTAGVFVGASISVSEADIAAVSKLSSVKAIYPVHEIKLPQAINPSILAAGDSPINPTDTFSPHAMTGVDRLHASSILGKGVRVGVVDTGIFFEHPALGGCFGPGCKVAGGRAYVQDEYTGPSGAFEPIAGGSIKDCAGHGTHVSGTVAASQNPLNFTGVAPEASLYGYRVFGCKGNTANDLVIAGMLGAYEDGMDVITVSIGGASGWSTGAGSVVAQRISAGGTPITISNGNSGSEGLFYTSDPAGGIGIFSVGSVQNIVTPSKFLAGSNGATYFYTASSTSLPTTTLSVAVSNPDTTVANDGCVAYPAGTFTGKAAVIRRGSCSFSVKAQNALDAGAALLILYNNVAGTITPDIGGVAIQYIMLSQDDGRALIAAVTADPALTISFPDGYRNVENKLDGGLMSDFSSYGPSFDLLMKPSISAPGGNILSTYIDYKYQVLSGTSMAAPFMAGSLALFIGHNGKIDPIALRNIFQSTSTPVPDAIGSSTFNTVAQQGAGLVNAYAAVIPTTFISPAEINLNDTLHLAGPQTFKISNLGSSPKSYRISNKPAQAALAFGANGNQPNAGPPPLVSGAASVVFSSEFVTVAGGASVDVVATFTPPTSLNAKNVPVYSGFIAIEATDDSVAHQVVYQGVAASMFSDYPIFDTSDFYFGVPLPALATASGEFATGPSTYTFSGGDAPAVVYRLLGGSAKITADLVRSTSTFDPTIKSRRFPWSKRQTTDTVGRLASDEYFARNIPTSQDSGEGYYLTNIGTATGLFFANGSKVPNGTYKILVRALKFYGNPDLDASYESWLSPEITVNQS